MIPVEPFYRALEEQGVGFYSGVPDSLLKNFCAYLTDHSPNHVIAANEGNAVGLAAGYYLATGRPGLVYMQNSGLGNAVNPLLSLVDSEVYGVPLVLLIGWRGEPGVKDEPQHKKQGRVTPALLDAMEIPYSVLGPDSIDWQAVVSGQVNVALTRNKPVALLVKAGTFDAYKLQTKVVQAYPLDREEVIRHIVERLADRTFVSTTGFASRELFEIREKSGQGHGKDFLTVGSMGHSLQIAVGLAWAQPKVRVCCLDGDGAVLMQMGGLAVAAQSGRNFLHVLLNNGCHDSVGGQPTVGHSTDFLLLAQAVGYKARFSVSTAEALDRVLGQVENLEGPVFVEVRIHGGARVDLGRPTTSTLENKQAFMASLGVK